MSFLPGIGSLYIMISNNLAEKFAIIDPEVRDTMEADRKLQSEVREVLNKAKKKKKNA